MSLVVQLISVIGTARMKYICVLLFKYLFYVIMVVVE